MKRSCRRMVVRSKLGLLAAIVAAPALAGCRAPAPPADPFLYRSTIPPPGTVTPVPGAQPYYAPPATMSAPMTAPPTISPGAPIAPSTAPITPAPAPAPLTPAPPPNNRYAPPGGFNYQSSTRSPGAFTQPAVLTVDPATSRPVAPVASAATNGASDLVLPASGWQAPKTTSDDPFTKPMPSSPQTDAGVVRIVEPATTAATSTPATTAAPAPTQSSSASSATASPAAPPTASTSVPAADSASTSPPKTDSAATTPPLSPAADQAAIPEITDLPVAPAGGDQMTAAKVVANSPVSISGERPGTTYGYDPDYKTLRGKLEYSVASRRWRLSYLPAEGPIDEFGGNVVLPDANQLQGFEAGDYVVATGTFSAPTAAAGPAMFAIQRIKRQ